MTKQTLLARFRLPGKPQPNWLKGLIFTAILASLTIYWLVPVSSAENQTDNNKKRSNRAREHDEAPIAVAVESVKSADFEVYLDAIGTVTAQRTVTVKSRVDGELRRINFKEGQWVKEGELLAEIDPRPFQIQLQQAEGQLLREQALLSNAELDQKRYQTLLEQDSIAAQQTAMQSALVKQYQGSVIMNQAQLNNAKLQLEYAKLVAPIAGQLGLRQLDEGNIIHASDSNGLVVITQLQPIDVIFSLAEDKLPAAIQHWRNNPAISVVAYDRSGHLKLANGQLKAIDNQIDPSTGTIKLKAQFDNREQSLFANQFVNIKMQLETLKSVIQVPTAAIQHDNSGAYLYVAANDNTVEQRRVNLGPSANDKTVLFDNISAQELVIVDGLDRLKPGSKIDIAIKDGTKIASKSPSDQTNRPQGKPAKQGA